jgi:hypothetical protein
MSHITNPLRYHKARNWCVQKLGGKCLDCGLETKFYFIYDFHHLNGRNNKVDVEKWFKSQEIPSDVVLLCANCHRFRTTIGNRLFKQNERKNADKPVFGQEFKWKR